MKRITLVDLAIVFAIGATLVPTAKAHGSSHPPQAGDQPTAGFVPWTEAQRVITWNSERHWQTVDGTILICPRDAAATRDKKCRDKKNDKLDRWLPLTSYSIPGFEIAGFQYSFTGSLDGYQQLTVYYRAPRPVVAVAPTKDPVTNITLTGPITIKTDKVIVQRKRK